MTIFPFEFIEYHTGDFCGRAWVRIGDDFYEEVEAIAAKHADIRGVEIDVISCAVDADRKIVGREREGIRVRPASAPRVSAFGEVA